MSASREKKQRQSDLGSLTEKQKKDRQEAAARKHKVIRYWVIGIVAAIVAAVLLIWNTGVFTRGATAATVGDRKYSVADTTFYYRQVANMWGQYGIRPEAVYDEETGKTYADFFKDQALETMKEVTALLDAAKAEGYTLSAAGQAQIDANFESIDETCSLYGFSRSAYFSQTYGKLMKEGDFKRLLTEYVTAYDYASSHQESLTYDDAALLAYYKENSDTLDKYDYRYFFISGAPAAVTDEEGNKIEATDEEKAAAMSAAKLKAEQALKEIESAADREAALIAAASKYVAESSKAAYEDPDYSLNEGYTGKDLVTYRPFASWMMEEGRTAGDVTYVEESNGYYVALFLDRYQDTAPTVNARHILIKAALTAADDPATEDVDESTVPTQEALDAAKAECERILAQWESGEKTAASFGALAEKYSADAGSNTRGGLYKNIPQGMMFEGFNAWIFDPARQAGDTALIENLQQNQQGWHIVYFEGEGAPVWMNAAESAIRTADQTAWMESLTEGYEAVAADGMASVG